MLLTIAFLRKIVSIFLRTCPDTYPLGLLSVLDSGLFQILFEIHSNIKMYCFPAEVHVVDFGQSFGLIENIMNILR